MELLKGIDQCTYLLPMCAFKVLDEADRMLDMGFEEDVRFILGKTCSGSLLGFESSMESFIKMCMLMMNQTELESLLHTYRTFRDNSPYPSDQVVKEHDGSFAFVVYDSMTGTVLST
ncbi:hypothetical protein COLO4_32838 [Corchorus olitorius]|uniref:DUF3700 domain-containing protein n=1 Tax=Corchorus olitorius TaxID=93759 RepID=A0A1R3GXP4_9ROSI|nr:hypothetical protein COLO4_32838 [Corchorus olitorius]